METADESGVTCIQSQYFLLTVSRIEKLSYFEGSVHKTNSTSFVLVIQMQKHNIL